MTSYGITAITQTDPVAVAEQNMLAGVPLAGLSSHGLARATAVLLTSGRRSSGGATNRYPYFRSWLMPAVSRPAMLAWLSFMTVSVTGIAQAHSVLPPIQEVNGLSAHAEFSGNAFGGPPLVLKSDGDADRVLSENSSTRLKDTVNWNQQVALVFAWQGSGQDRLRFNVLESAPEQIAFEFVPGRTRDLRRHCVVFLLRGDVTWNIRGRRGANDQASLPKKLNAPLLFRDAQAGFSGVSGHLWTINSDGQWKHQTFLNETISEPEHSGQLTDAELQQVIAAIERARLFEMPATLGTVPEVNPHEFSIEYGNARTALRQTGGASLPDTSKLPADSPLARFVALAWSIRQLVQPRPGE